MPKRASHIVITIAALMGFLLFSYRFFVPPDSPTASGPIEIATGQTNGVYDRFTRAAARQVRLPLRSKPTAGSLENIEMLRSGQADYAIVQSDIAQYYFFGERQRPRFSQLALVMPLFPEFIQILVPTGSDIGVLADLRGKRVCLGEQGSGTHFNSIDVFSQAGLYESIDFAPVNAPTGECISRLLRSQGVDAVFVTSNLDYARANPRLRQLFLSEATLQSVVSRYPYYRIDRRSGADESTSQLVVDALLVTHSGESAGNVYALTRQLVERWENLAPGIDSPIQPGERAATHRIAYHGAAQSALISLGVHRRNYVLYGLAGAWALLLMLCLVSERAKNSYNRLGESSFSRLTQTLLVNGVGRVSQAFIALTTLILFFVAAVYFLFWMEDVYAARIGAVSPFSAMSFIDSILWLFTYIASGFNADGIYPVSVPGKVIVAVLAVIGLVAPITIVVYVVDLMNRKTQRRLQGLSVASSRNHVVICGWNEKVRGLIYTLTGKDVDRPLSVVLVANIDEQYPLEKFGFNRRYVSYCRGDPSDPTVLQRANVAQAAVVLVLADFQASAGHNRKTILTAMNARRANAGAYICAELEYVDNVDFFQTADCDSLIYPGLVISNLATATVLNPLVLDYVMDVITYHEYDELRSVPVAQLSGLTASVGRPIGDLERQLVTQGVNLVGVMSDMGRGRLRECVFGSADQRGALLDPRLRCEPLKADHILVYSAECENLHLRSSSANSIAPITDGTFAIQYPKRLRVLICGDAESIGVLKRGLKRVIGDGLVFDSIDIEQKNLRYMDDIDKLAPREYDRVVLLNPQRRRSELTTLDDLHELDADQILLTGLFRRAFARRGQSPEIIAEVSEIKNKPLLLTAGAKLALPALLAVERFFSHQAYDRNHVTDFLMAAMNLEDGIHLHSHSVFAGDGFCGRTYAEILSTPIDGAKVLGWLPYAERDALRNAEGDLEFHFRTVVDARLKYPSADEGDEIIMLVEKRAEYRAQPPLATAAASVSNRLAVRARAPASPARSRALNGARSKRRARRQPTCD